jgi:hypothetical protein
MRELTPNLDGIEFAADIVRAMDLAHAASNDESLRQTLDALRAAFNRWRS